MFADESADKYYPAVNTFDVTTSDVNVPLQPRYTSGRSQSKLFEHSPPVTCGRPTAKALIDKLDTLAVLVTILCFIAAIVIIDPVRPYAARLQSSGQIVALGFLLGVMNQCLRRVLPYLFILLESQYGTPSLQNYEGLLRWSPFTTRLDIIWRSALFVLFALPLGLSVLYKQFIGGRGSLSLTQSEVTCGPTGPPGMQGNAGFITLFSNLTAPFLAATRDGFDVPSSNFFDDAHVYGFNTILLSNFYYNETYTAQILIEQQVPILHAVPALYIVLALQPVLTILAYCGILAMYQVPIGRTFGLISIMAGVDRDTLGLL